MKSSKRPRILVMGGSGMLGHKVVQVFGESFCVTTTFREPDGPWPRLDLDNGSVQGIGGVDAADFASVRQAVERTLPDVVINCIGVVKQLHSANDTFMTMQINALFPHRLASLCRAVGARLIHISTDCVFSGSVGGYGEFDVPDAQDLYGRSKQFGEVIGPNCLTIRTSIIGREITKTIGLLEWFISQRGGAANGYTRAVFSGLTTLELCRVLAMVLSEHADLAGLLHVASQPISKHDLLTRIDDVMDLGVTLRPVERPVVDRSLDGSRFFAATGIRVRSWDKMISDLATDPTPYDELRGQHGST